MMNSRKGLSTIVATLIIILLVMVAVGIVWVVVRNVVQGGSQQIALKAKCVEVEVQATKVINTSVNDYNVTLFRSAGGDDIGGVRLIFSSEGGTSNVVENIPGNIASLESKTVSVDLTDLPDSNKVEVYVYFNDDSGNEQLCQTASEFNF